MSENVISEDDRFALIQEVTEALRHVDSIAHSTNTEVSYETLQRSGFRRPDGWRRKYTLADARGEARNAAMRLRAAWEILDPSTKTIGRSE